MSNKRLEVFIQDLKDTTTVLQQLEVCIKYCKDVLNSVDTIEQSVEDLNIDDAESELNTLSNKVNDIINALPNKQDTLVAGDNIQINENVISATYPAYTAGSNIQINDGVISATDTTYTAGTNISIENNVISATAATYTAGSGIDITSDTISVDTDTIATKDYVDGKANLAMYEYEVEFIDNDSDYSWYYRFYTSQGNIAEPHSLSDLKQLVETYGINYGTYKALIGYYEYNGNYNFSKCYISNNNLFVTRVNSTDIQVSLVTHTSFTKRTC